jgi:hypothetical protein
MKGTPGPMQRHLARRRLGSAPVVADAEPARWRHGQRVAPCSPPPEPAPIPPGPRLPAGSDDFDWLIDDDQGDSLTSEIMPLLAPIRQADLVEPRLRAERARPRETHP